MTIRSHSTTITVPKSTLTFQLHLQDQVLLNLYIRISTRVSRVQVQVQVSRLHVIKWKAAKLRIQEETRAEKMGKDPKKQAAKYGVNFHVIDTCG